ncbi:hypothetical protein DKG34_39030 [Streptomyces sp. NWU49]|uniref:MFS transporter n=1 Tax=Streptomyces sp. NWU49 TaxID=2201153 RepID=UPI000D683D36|nr:MFS transporter [Streptomyces sp. NWU49]PWJ02340.1 hypothetical protein DKG34_39030 [Streptomyces sp. NWU49]
MSHDSQQIRRADDNGDPARNDAMEDGFLRVIMVSSVLSKVANWQMGVVVPLTILERTNSVAETLLSFALRGVAFIASPLLGFLIDRFDKRVIYVGSQLQQAVCLVLLALLPADQITVSTLLLLSGVGAATGTITGQFVLVPSLISAERRALAAAKLASSLEFAKVIGVVIGGAAFSAWGASPASLCIAGLYGGAGLLALLLPKVPSRAPRKGLRHDLAVGFQWVGKPEITWLVVTMATVNLAIGQLEPALITVFKQEGINALLISTVIGVGLFIGAVGSRLSPHILPSWSMAHRILAFQLMSLVALCLVAVPHLLVKIPGFMCVSFAIGACNVASITFRQETIPVDLAGRVNAVIRMFIMGAIPLSGALYAWSSRFDGYRFWLPELALAAVAVLVWGLHARGGERAAATSTERGAQS